MLKVIRDYGRFFGDFKKIVIEGNVKEESSEDEKIEDFFRGYRNKIGIYSGHINAFIFKDQLGGTDSFTAYFIKDCFKSQFGRRVLKNYEIVNQGERRYLLNENYRKNCGDNTNPSICRVTGLTSSGVEQTIYEYCEAYCGDEVVAEYFDGTHLQAGRFTVDEHDHEGNFRVYYNSIYIQDGILSPEANQRVRNYIKYVDAHDINSTCRLSHKDLKYLVS
jgi:hypothetical protein